MALNLVAPAGPLVSTCLWVTGVGLLLRNRRSVLVGTSWAEVLGGLFALLIALFWYQSPQAVYDSGLYYLQTIRWMTEHSLRLGLANLHSRLAYNSVWFAFAAAVELPLLSGHSSAFVNILPMVLVSALAGVGFKRLTGAGRRFGDAALALLFPVVGHAVGGLGAASTDQSAELLVSLALALWVGALGSEDEEFPPQALPAAYVTLLAVLVKLSVVPLIAIAILAIFSRRRALSLPWAVRLAVPGAIAFALWIGRSVLLSGCFAYPIAWTCVTTLPWSLPARLAGQEAIWIRSWARIPKLPPDQVLADWSWLRIWAANMGVRSDIRMFGATLLAGSLLTASARPTCRPLWIALGVALLGIAYVFLTAPDPRFAFGFLHAVGLLPIAYTLSRLRRSWSPPLSTLALTALGGLTLCWAEIGFVPTEWRADGVAFPRPPTPALVQRVSETGYRVWTPAQGYQCWDAPLPCTPYFSPDLSYDGVMYRQPSAPERTTSAEEPSR